MRTTKEIIERARKLKKIDFFGFEFADIVMCLSFEDAKQLLSEEQITETNKKEWGDPKPRDRESVLNEIIDYMPFAWGKANDRRGLSAGRSILHMSAWFWLLGEDDLSNFLEDYEYYGKGKLRAICEALGLDWKQWDDGYWSNYESQEGDPPPENVDPLPLKNEELKKYLEERKVK